MSENKNGKLELTIKIITLLTTIIELIVAVLLLVELL